MLHAAAGEAVAVDELVLIIETDKLAVEVRSPVAGAFAQAFAAAGDTVDVGANLYSVIPGAAGAAAPAAAAKAAAPAASAPAPAAPAKAAAPAPAAPAAAAAKKPAAGSAAPAPTPAGARTEKRVQMSMMRTRISQRLKEAQNTTAMLTTFQEVCVRLPVEFHAAAVFFGLCVHARACSRMKTCC
jgi:2-oxoglutarate dehydrogenase E2 component (dihydrolipoamide succinyltransferase)